MNNEYWRQLICSDMMESGPAALLLNSLFQGQSKVLIVDMEGGGAAAVVGEGANGEAFEGGCRSRGGYQNCLH